MEILSVSEIEYNSPISENANKWNGRETKWIAGDRISSMSIPFMQKVQGEIVGGYHEESGGYIEGKISFSIGGGEAKSNKASPEPKNVESKPDAEDVAE